MRPINLIHITIYNQLPCIIKLNKIKNNITKKPLYNSETFTLTLPIPISDEKSTLTCLFPHFFVVPQKVL